MLPLTLQYLQIREPEQHSTRSSVFFRPADIERLGLLSIPQVRSNQTMYVRSGRHAHHLQGDAAAACRLCNARNAHCIRLAVRASKPTPCPDGLIACASAELPLESSSALTRAQETKRLPETAWRLCVRYGTRCINVFAGGRSKNLFPRRLRRFVVRQFFVEVSQKIEKLDWCGTMAEHFKDMTVR